MSDPFKLIVGVVVAVTLSLAGFTLKWQFDANAKLAIIVTEQKALVDKVERLSVNAEQNRQLRLLWRYCAWLDSENASLRYKAGLAPANHPDWSE